MRTQNGLPIRIGLILTLIGTILQFGTVYLRTQGAIDPGLQPPMTIDQSSGPTGDGHSRRAALTVTLTVPIISGSYRTCLGDYLESNFIGSDGPCTVQDIIQPDYSGLPAAAPVDVLVHWDTSGGSVPLEFYQLSSPITWTGPLPAVSGLAFQTVADSLVGATHISPSTFAALRAGTLGIMVNNPSGKTFMDTQGWHLEAVYTASDVPPTPPPPASTTTLIVPIISGSFRTCLGDYPEFNNVGADGACNVQQIVQPDYSSLPAASPVDVIVHWDNSGVQVPLEFYRLSGPITWQMRLPSGTIFKIAYNTAGVAHISLPTFAALRAANAGIMVNTPWNKSQMDTQGWSLEAVYASADVPPTPPLPASTTSVDIPLISGSYRTCLQDYPNFLSIGADGPCSVQQIMQPDYSGLPAAAPLDVILHWDNSGSQVPLEFYRLAGAIPWGAPLPSGSIFKIRYSTDGSAHISLATFALLKAGNLGIMVNTAWASSHMDYQLWRIEVVYASTPVITPAQAVQGIVNTIAGFNLDIGTANSLTAKLQNVVSALDRGETKTAIAGLRAFINEVQAQRGKKLTEAQADELIAQANAVLAQFSGVGPAPTFMPKR